MSDKEKAKLVLKYKATMEASRLSRGNMYHAYEKIDELRVQMKTARGDRHQYLRMVIDILESKTEKKEESIANIQYGNSIEGGGWI